MKKKKIMIVGAGMLQTYVIKRAKELGYYTICVDGNANAHGFVYADEYQNIDIIDKEKCLDYAEKCNIDGVITAATDYGVLTVSYIASRMKLLGLKYAVAEIIKNKYSIRKLLSEVQPDDVFQYFEINTINDLESMEYAIKYPVIIKPCDGSGSRGVAKIENKQELIEAVKNAIVLSVSKRALIETFIEGQEYGVESFVCDNKVYILGMMKKIMTQPPYYSELGHIIPSGLSMEIEDKIKMVVTKSIQLLGINFGPINMDLLITKDNKICIIDIGARMGGNLIGSHIIPFSTGIDYMGNIIKSAVNDTVDFNIQSTKIIATSILALTPGRIKNDISLEKIKNKNNVIDVVFNKKKGDNISFYKNNLDGCGYVVTTGINTDNASSLAFQLKKEIDNLIERE
jgi:carbamoyl-phosphate synthase large subunit